MKKRGGGEERGKPVTKTCTTKRAALVPQNVPGPRGIPLSYGHGRPGKTVVGRQSACAQNISVLISVEYDYS